MIYKYKLELQHKQFLHIPNNSEILKTDYKIDENAIMIWIYSQDHNDLIEKEFLIVGTGNEFKERHLYKYLDTVFIRLYVWHVFVRDK